MILNKKITEILANFNFFNSWEEKYEYLIELGRELPALQQKYKIDNYLIRGCQSKVWLCCEYKNKKLYFYADSDAMITKGIVALIIKLYSGLSAKELMTEDFGVFSKIGLKQHLSMTRVNGLNMMLETIKKYGLNYYKHE